MAEANVERSRLPEAAARVREQGEADGIVRAGVLGGLLAGALMLLWVMVGAAVDGDPVTRPLAATAATFGGDMEAIGPAGLFAGAVIWAGVSVALALVFAMFVPRDFPTSSAALLGVGYAFLVLAVVASVALPRINPEMRGVLAEAGGKWTLAFAVYGAALGFLPALRRRASRRRKGRAAV